ncbi:subtilisin Savinase domain protein [Pseudarthrobacter siccitolerans]|uniref:Subtilisin Savinase domain protein n=1 Tax=Pseudarthrobacter siccitolerans TaxID=861266 RepID=A0A024GYP9_9MICC|nr:S8 family serine peptidase [Pseudarthrobacter siccitolerans]CCQ45070.1 subtilisin Savinase domain protein [Pseudarthrobacter siccitolerans]
MIDPNSFPSSENASGSVPEADYSGAETTGRFIVVFAREEGSPSSVLESAGLSNVADSRDFTDREVDVSETSGADATFFSSLGIAVVSAEPEQIGALQTTEAVQGAVLSVSPELIHHVLPAGPTEYVRGYRDAVLDLDTRLNGGNGRGAAVAAPPTVPIFQDTAQFTWGLQAVQAHSSHYSGRGVKVAVLDTGFDSTHPDFAGRNITVRSFIPGESATDGHGHGTHCIGTSCGSKSPSTGPRYGVAYEAEIFAGKVLSNAGSGSDAGILAGIDWALTSGCAIISMSLGADVPQIHPPYVAAGERALDAGTLIIAAAGNNAKRLQGNNGFVGTPANSPFIMAVGALDHQLDLAFFSARSLPVRGGQVDVAGPGWQVYSSWPMPARYRSISGTSMATPHAAGIAALWAQATGFRGRELWSSLVQESDRLIAPSVDVGSGLVIAPL